MTTKVELSNDAKKLLKLRYCKPDEEPEEVYPRVAKALGEHDGYEKEFLNVMASRRFLPNSPALMNAGLSNALKACFVLPIHDSMESIFKTLKDAAMTFQAGGGCGYSFSELRQKGASLSNGGSSSGVLSFMAIYDAITEAVKQGSRRRGASMGVLDIDHPEIFDFIKAKLTPGTLSNFNLSVMVNDEFMDKIVTDEYQYLHDVQDRRRTVGKFKARDLFNIICFSAYLTGDPGLMFYDRINQDNQFKEKIKASNPCISGDTLVETPMGFKEAKAIQIGDRIITGEDTVGVVDTIERHASMRVYRVETEVGHKIDATASHQFYARKRNTWMTRFFQLRDLKPGDYLISKQQNDCAIKSITPMGKYEVFDIHEPTTDSWITNGIISRGCGEVCMFPYESCCLGSINLNEHIVDNDIDWPKFKETAEIGSQMLLSINKYSEYPVDECYKQNYKMNRIGLGLMGFADALMKMHIKYDSDETLELVDKITECMLAVAKKKAPTSASVLSVAPTGSISILGSCSPSIEPIFSESYTRNLTFGTIDEVRERNEYLRTAHEVSPMWHLKIQAQFQKTIDNAVSKCLRKGTLIATNKGLIPIESFHSGKAKGFENVNDEIYVLDENGMKQRILRGYYDGKGVIITVKLDGNLLFEGSGNHLVKTTLGWKRLSELTTDDYLLKSNQFISSEEYQKTNWKSNQKTNANVFRLPEICNENLGTWLGMIVSDGHLEESSGHVGISEKNSAVAKQFDTLTYQLFGIETKKCIDKRNNVVDHYLTSRNLVRILRPLLGYRAATKKIPNMIFRSPASVQMGFLKGLTLDGYIEDGQLLVIYNGLSKNVAWGVQKICENLGMHTQMYIQTVMLKGKPYCTYATQIQYNPNFIFTPIEPHKCKYRENEPSLVPSENLKEKKDRVLLIDNSYSYKVLERWKRGCGFRRATLDKYKIKFDEWIHCRKVQEIKTIWNDDMYDIEVEGNHTYLVDGIITHNTVNLPHDATIQDIYDVYYNAWKMGCKGVTVFRDGSKGDQVMVSNPTSKCDGETCYL